MKFYNYLLLVVGHKLQYKMQTTNWVYAFASTIGNSHIMENIPCQDFCMVQNYKNFMISVVADGAGSCKNSDKGAMQVCSFALYHFENAITKQNWLINNELPTEENWHKLAKQTLFEIRKDLDRYSMSNDLDFKSLSCTVIVVIALQNGLLVTHIGDGRAGYCNQNDEWFSMMIPFHGQEANETVFITSEIWNDNVVDNYIESRVISENVKAFCLLSDGCEKASFECNLYDEEQEIYYDPNIPFKDFFHKNINLHLPNLYKQNKSQEEINNLWKSFLTSGNEKLRIEPDDKTIILAVKI